MDSWVGVKIYLYHVPSIPKLKGVRLKNLPIDSHFSLAMVGAEPLLQRSAAYDTNSYSPTLDGRTSSREAADTPLLKWPYIFIHKLKLKQLLVI